MTRPDDLPVLPAFIAERLAQPRAVALAERVGGRTLALRSDEVHGRAAAVAYALRARGIAAGDRVALIANNRVDWLVADFGILYAGCVVVPTFATTAADQLRFILADSEAKLVFTDDAATAAAIRAAAPDAPPIVAFEGDGEGSFAAFVAAGTALHAADPPALAGFAAGAAPDDLAVLIYTSGTTGIPKGVMLSHRNLVSDAVTAFDRATSGVTEGAVALSVLPFAHIYEHTNALGFLYTLAAHYVTVPERLMDDLRVLRPVFVAFVPRIFERLLAGIVGNARARGGAQAKLVPWALEVGAAYERARRDGTRISPALRLRRALANALVLKKIKPKLGLDRLAYFVSGSAPLHRDTALTLAGMGLEICEGYGLTETSPTVTVNRPADNILGSVGPPLPNVQVKIAADGEVLVKGPNVMLGYYHVPAAEQPFTADGWFQTGDIGELRGTHLYITDRKRELFKSSGGKWISPARIESAIKRSVYVGQVMAFGNSRPHPGVLLAPNWELVRRELEHSGRPHDRRAGAPRRRARADGARGRDADRGPGQLRADSARRDLAARPDRRGRRALAHAQGQAAGGRAALRAADRGRLRRGPACARRQLMGSTWRSSAREPPSGRWYSPTAAAQTRHAWAAGARAVAEAGWSAYSFDLRGHGQSDRAPEGRYDLDGFVADIAAVAALVGRPAVFVGASLGGLAATVWAGEHGGDGGGTARGLVLVDVGVRARAAGVERIVGFMQRHADGFASLEEAAGAVAAYAPGRERGPRPDGLRKNLRLDGDGRYRWHWDPRLLDSFDAEQVLHNARVEAALRALRVPLCVVHGGHSDVLDAAIAQETARLGHGSVAWSVRRRTWWPATPTTPSARRCCSSWPRSRSRKAASPARQNARTCVTKPCRRSTR